jgi:Tol biopolymer transport system component
VAISADGRFVAFQSAASNLVLGDTNGTWDVFVRDRKLGITERVSVSSSGEQGDELSGTFSLALSADGRFVAFNSYATNLVLGGTSGTDHVFVRDRKLGATELVSVSSSGEQANDSSDNGLSNAVAISADGRFVAFQSYASNLVPNDTNALPDIFVRDRKLGVTGRVSVGQHGEQTNGFYLGGLAISAHGRFVAFVSDAAELVSGPSGEGWTQVFVRDRKQGTTELVSVTPNGRPNDQPSGTLSLAISADGRFVAFDSYATNLVKGDTNNRRDVFVRDRIVGRTERVSVGADGTQANRQSGFPSLSANGRFVAFSSPATDLVPGDTNRKVDIFVHDRLIGTTQRASISSSGVQGNGGSFVSAISGDGRTVTFVSDASNLVPHDTNNARDVFVRTR